MTFSDNVLKAMKEKGLNSTQLAKKSGVNESRLSEVLSGKTKSPRLDTVIKLAKALEMSLSDLVGEKIAAVHTDEAEKAAQFFDGIPLRSKRTKLLSKLYEFEEQEAEMHIVETLPKKGEDLE